MTGVLEAVAVLRALADHRERMPDCLCRRDDEAGKTPRTADDHAGGCHERIMVEKLREAAAGAEEEHRNLVASLRVPLGSKVA